MRAFVFTDPALTSRAGQFVWLELNVDDERNAAQRERLSLEALPTFYVVNPADESVVMRRVDGMTVAEMESFLDEARAAATRPAPSSPAGGRAPPGRPPERRGEEAPRPPTAYREALDEAPAAWPPYGRAVVALLFLAAVARRGGGVPRRSPGEALPRLVRHAGVGRRWPRSGLDCALGLPKDDAARAAAVAEMEVATRKTLALPAWGGSRRRLDELPVAHPGPEGRGRPAGAGKDAEAWASFLEAQAAAGEDARAARGLRLAPALRLPGAEAAGAGGPDARGVGDATFRTTTTRRPASPWPTSRRGGSTRRSPPPTAPCPRSKARGASASS